MKPPPPGASRISYQDWANCNYKRLERDGGLIWVAVFLHPRCPVAYPHHRWDRTLFGQPFTDAEVAWQQLGEAIEAS